MALMALLASCSKEQSYSELLRDEEKTVNWFLSNQKVEAEIPSDSVFLVGEDAPFYKMDEDGHVYMQVLNVGDKDSRPVEGDKVYFRYMMQNLQTLEENGTAEWVGNSDNLGGIASTSFIFGNRYLPSTTQFGMGVQVPLHYLGYNCEVNLVVKSLEGFSEVMATCTPYLMNIRYFKAEY